MLISACLSYTVAAACEYWLLDWMSSLFNIHLAIFSAIVQNASWPLQLVVYYNQRAKAKASENIEREITWSMYRTYFILGLLNSVISISRMIGLTTLPPTIYVIAANSEIIFEALLTRCYLHRTVSRWQMLSVLCVILGVAISLYKTPSMRQKGDDTDTDTGTYTDGNGDIGTEGEGAGGVNKSLGFGVTVTILSRLASALNTVLADKLLGDDRKTYMGVLECSLGNALVPSATLPLLLLVVPEYTTWPEELHSPSHSTMTTTLITLLFVSLCISKYIDRVSKFYIIANTSTLFFAVIDANMKIIAGIGAFVLFGESIFWPKIVGFALIATSLLLSVFEKISKANYFKFTSCLESLCGVVIGDKSSGNGYRYTRDDDSCEGDDDDDDELGIMDEGLIMQPMLLTNTSHSYTSTTPQNDDINDYDNKDNHDNHNYNDNNDNGHNNHNDKGANRYNLDTSQGSLLVTGRRRDLISQMDSKNEYYDDYI